MRPTVTVSRRTSVRSETRPKGARYSADVGGANAVHETALGNGYRVGRTFWRGLIAGTHSFEELSELNAVQRSDLVELGVPAAILTTLSLSLHMPREHLYATLGLSRATVDRKIKAKANLTVEQSESVVGIARLVGQVARIVRESGNTRGFNAAQWVAEFLERPNPALGGRRPASLMKTSDGRSAVSAVIAQMQTGAYS